MSNNTQDLNRKWFHRGIALVWIPSVPFVLAVLYSLRGISEQRATGLGAIAGALATVYLPLVIVLTLGLEVAAIVLLLRSFSRSHVGRILLSAFSIAWSVLVIAGFSLLTWGFYVDLQRMRASH